jgi:hypothetical protein
MQRRSSRPPDGWREAVGAAVMDSGADTAGGELEGAPDGCAFSPNKEKGVHVRRIPHRIRREEKEEGKEKRPCA